MHTVYCFSVHAEALPGSLGRVLDVFNLYGGVPSQLVSRRDGAQGEELVIDVQVEAMTSDVAAAVARRLGRIVGVTNVLFSAKRYVGAPARWAA